LHFGGEAISTQLEDCFGQKAIALAMT